MNIVIPNDKPELAEAAARAIDILNSDDGAQFDELRRLGAPEGVLREWSYSTLDRAARARRKVLVFSVAYGVRWDAAVADFVPVLPQTDPGAWKAAHSDIVAAFDIQFRPLPPRAP